MNNKTKKTKKLNSVSRHQTQVRALILAIMKEKGMGYEVAAKRIKISLSTFKRKIRTGNFLLSEFVRLGEALEISLPGIFTLEPENTKALTAFTLKQENYLAAHPNSFYLLILIMVGHDLERLSQAIQLEEKEVKKILFELDRINLVEILPGSRFRVSSMGPFYWLRNGPLEKKYFYRFVNELVRHMTTEEQTSSWKNRLDHKKYFRPFEFYLTSESYKEFQKESEKLIDRFHAQAIVEADAVTADRLQVVSGFLSFDQFDAWRSTLLPTKKAHI